MQDFSVAIYPAREKTFLASYLHPLTKRRVRAHFDSKEKATEYKHRIESQFKRSNPDNYRDLTVEELLLLFKNDQPKADFAGAKMYITDFIETFGQLKIDDLTTDALKMWLDQIQVENGIKEISMRGIKCSVDVFFKYLVKKEVISESPLTTIFYKRPVPDVNARNLLSKSEIQKLLDAAKSYSPGYLFPILKLFAETAVKPNEVVDLNWKQVDLEKRQINFLATDSSQARTLSISEELKSILEKNKKATGPVFMTYYREPFTKVKLARLVNEFKIKGNFKLKWTPMDLRHSFAVNFLLAGGDMKQLQYILGHQKVFDTKRLYAEVLSTRAQATAVSPFEIGSLDANRTLQESRAAQDPTPILG